MSALTKRQRIGIALMLVAVLVGIVFQLRTGKVFHRPTVHQETWQSGSGFVMAVDIDLGISRRYAGSPLLAFAAGLTCYLWPTRKPPQIV
jgi:hypothetical protein